MMKQMRKWILLLLEIVLCGASFGIAMGDNQWNDQLVLALGTAAGALCVCMTVWSFVTARREQSERTFHIFYGLAFVLIFILYCILMVVSNAFGL